MNYTHNNTVVESITLEDYEEMLKNHDWYYGYTEDSRVYAAGERAYNRIIAHSKQSEQHADLFDTFKCKYFNNGKTNN